jgi:SAM-dependent methyltransferase
MNTQLHTPQAKASAVADVVIQPLTLHSTVAPGPAELLFPTRACPVCRGEEREVLYRQRFAEFSEEGLLAGYDVVVCRHCGTCFGDHLPTQAAFDRYYGVMSKYESNWHAPNPNDPDRLRFEAMVPIIARAARPDERVLEIGCASGGLLNALKQHGFSQLRGIDPSPTCGKIARECYGIEVDCATFSSLKTTGPVADLVILIGVMEHVCDLEQTMTVLKTLVPVGGRLFVTVPDASRYATGEDAPYQEFSVEHINYFGPGCMANLMDAHGFDQVFCERGTIQANVRTVTPVIHGAFIKRAETSGAWKLKQADTETEAGLREYIAKSGREHQAVMPVLAALVRSQEPVLIWGAGAHTLRLLAGSPLAQANLVGVIDSNPRYQGKRIAGLPVFSPKACPNEQATVLISSRVYQDEISRQIRERLGWKNKLLTLY